jgi:hypothetical protein
LIAQSRNRRRADVVAAGDVGKRLALIPALDRLALLVVSEFERSAHFLSARHGPRSAFASARADQIALELGQPAEDGQHQPGAPGIGERKFRDNLGRLWRGEEQLRNQVDG